MNPAFLHRQRAITVLGGTVITLSALTAFSAPVEADTGLHVVGTDGDGLYVHTDPGLSTPTTTVLAEGTTVTSDCLGYADTIGGTDPVWLHVTSPVQGWIADWYTDSSWDRNNTLVQQGIPECGATTLAPAAQAPVAPPPTDTASSPSEQTLGTPYDRDAAAA